MLRFYHCISFMKLRYIGLLALVVALVCCSCNDKDNDAMLRRVTIQAVESNRIAIDRGETIKIKFGVAPAQYNLKDNQVRLILTDANDCLALKGVESLGEGQYYAVVEDLDKGIPYSTQLSVCISDNEVKADVISNAITFSYAPREYTHTVQSNDIVYDGNSHAAFTGMLNYNGVLYLAFREGTAHRPASVADYGVIKVLSNNGAGWKECGIIRDATKDLRDPFLIEVDGKLRAYIGYNTFEGDRYQHSGSVYSDFENGEWSDVKAITHDVPHIVWLWKVRKYEDTYYSVAYLEGELPALLSSEDGITWKTVTYFQLDGILSEADMAFIGKTMYVCLRKDQPIGSPSFWGVAKYPFEEFKWAQMDKCVESPELLRLPYSNHILLAGRERYVSSPNVSASLFSVSMNGEMSKIATLDTETDGDVGYPSLIVKDGVLYCSYYTGFESKAQIKISKLSIE